MVLNFFIHLASLILFLNTGANDILVSCATPIGSRSLHRRAIIFLILLSAILSFYKLKSDHIPDSSWINIISDTLKNDPERGKEVLATAVISSAFFTILSIISKFPLPLDASFCAFFYGYLAIHNNSANFLTRRLILSYLILPFISGCFTWCIYRILIRGILFADAEEKFKRTLSWCALIYPSGMAIAVTIVGLKYFFYHYTALIKLFSGLLTIILSFGLFYAFFKVFLRAWLKRRVFLMYPQEYAVYMERSEKVEQGDREARGLGPIQNYYLSTPKSANASKQLHQSIKDTNSAILQPGAPAISPAVIAGKLAITSKRSEELFRPILNLLSIVTLGTLTSFESKNVLIIVNRALEFDNIVPSAFVFWSAFLLIIPGGLFLSQRYAVFLGRNIINDMRFSQAFAIQLGTLLTITLGLFLHSIPLAPLWYLLLSISAVCSSQETVDPTSVDNLSSDSDEVEVSFRQKLGYVIFFWTCSIMFSGAVGMILKVDQVQV